ncbi:Serine/threonine-protein kinase PknL [Rubripirellula obstinata]|uniref:Serine/threonine-protein kinase PknL n=1 Tax=Rubripirellula obstinata TaxID=406547 RepID=A0A5B1CEG6_9BACT|nr:serine/threonine-protein kinase [Rubripirellula obstinata]KAA1258612.1 Serine/threonine-protein kinase PknL [Rubripirellula obstinata]
MDSSESNDNAPSGLGETLDQTPAETIQSPAALDATQDATDPAVTQELTSKSTQGEIDFDDDESVYVNDVFSSREALVAHLTRLYGHLPSMKRLLDELAIPVDDESIQDVFAEFVVRARERLDELPFAPDLDCLRLNLLLSVESGRQAVLKTLPSKRTPTPAYYHPVQVLGAGAQGVVYKVYASDQWRVVKVSKTDFNRAITEEQKTREINRKKRFLREARSLSRIDHKNIIRQFASGELSANESFCEIEFVDGGTLSECTENLDRHSPLYEQLGLFLFAQVAQGLAHVHPRSENSSIGIIHRDIKADNILVSRDGQCKVADFGMAQLDSSSSMTQGGFLGTPTHTPPEQHHGEAVANSDVYALACTIYRYFTGKNLFTGGTVMKILHNTPSRSRLMISSQPIYVSFWIECWPRHRPTDPACRK